MAFTTRSYLYTLLEGETTVPDDVVVVFVQIIMEYLKKEHYPYKRRATITQPLALLIPKQEHTSECALTMTEQAACHLHDVDVVLLPIILNGHFHLLVLDNQKNEYQHYSSAESLTYDTDALVMVIISIRFTFF